MFLLELYDYIKLKCVQKYVILKSFSAYFYLARENVIAFSLPFLCLVISIISNIIIILLVTLLVTLLVLCVWTLSMARTLYISACTRVCGSATYHKEQHKRVQYQPFLCACAVCVVTGSTYLFFSKKHKHFYKEIELICFSENIYENVIANWKCDYFSVCWQVWYRGKRAPFTFLRYTECAS